MKTTRDLSGGYTVTGYTAGGELVQYTVSKNGHGWSVDLICGKGQQFSQLYSSKAEAVNAIKNQG